MAKMRAAAALLLLAGLFLQSDGQLTFKVACEDIKKWVFKEPIPTRYKPVFSEHDVYFFLYKRTNRKIPILLDIMTRLEINRNASTKVLIYDWFESGNAQWILRMKDAYLDVEDVNVILIEHYKSSSTYFSGAVQVIDKIGKTIANYLYELHLSALVDLSNTVHIVGSGYGAHLAGSAGRYISELFLGEAELYRLTGLDPPGFYAKPVDGLDRYSAKYVDVVHTDGKFFGSNEAIGSIDFFLNGRIPWQHKCYGGAPQKLFKTSACTVAYAQIMCSHLRSQEYWIESIKRNFFVSREGLRMGDKGNYWDDGVYQITTSPTPPYGLG